MTYFFLLQVLRSAGYDEAMLGLSLNKKQGVDGMPAVAERLAPKGHGHNKFLRQIVAWLEIRAPRYWWQEMDTYKTVLAAQSESTMHTLLKELKGAYDIDAWMEENFEPGSLSTQQAMDLRLSAESGTVESLRNVKKQLPEGFLQTRVLAVNYMTLQHIVTQRRNHRLPHWQDFCAMLEGQLPHYELVFGA